MVFYPPNDGIRGVLITNYLVQLTEGVAEFSCFQVMAHLPYGGFFMEWSVGGIGDVLSA